MHSICATLIRMKTAQMPPVRVEPAVREEIEGVLHEGEGLSQIVEADAVQAALRRKAQQEFVARGSSSLSRAKATGEFYALQGTLDPMRARLDARMAKAQRTKRGKTARP